MAMTGFRGRRPPMPMQMPMPPQMGIESVQPITPAMAEPPQGTLSVSSAQMPASAMLGDEPPEMEQQNAIIAAQQTQQENAAALARDQLVRALSERSGPTETQMNAAKAELIRQLQARKM